MNPLVLILVPVVIAGLIVVIVRAVQAARSGSGSATPL
jgi:hypothetical protein